MSSLMEVHSELMICIRNGLEEHRGENGHKRPDQEGDSGIFSNTATTPCPVHICSLFPGNFPGLKEMLRNVTSIT